MAKGKSGGVSRGLSAAPKTDAARERLWRAESALSSLRRADEVRRDPKLMADAKALAAREQAALAKVMKAK